MGFDVLVALFILIHFITWMLSLPYCSASCLHRYQFSEHLSVSYWYLCCYCRLQYCFFCRI